MDQIIDDLAQSQGKVYKERFITVATFFGGPLAAGYLMAENFKVFNESQKVAPTYIISILATIVMFAISFMIPDDVNFPNQIIPLTYTGIVYLLIRRFQAQNLENHIKNGGELYSGWRVFGISILVLAITVVPIFALVFIFGDLL